MLRQSTYLFFTLVLSNQVEWDGVERTGHDTKHAAQDECGDDVGEESNEAGAHAEDKVAHEVQRLQADVGQQETLHVWKRERRQAPSVSCHTSYMYTTKSQNKLNPFEPSTTLDHHQEIGASELALNYCPVTDARGRSPLCDVAKCLCAFSTLKCHTALY